MTSSFTQRIGDFIFQTIGRYQIQGTSENPQGYGPPYRAPWFLIDVSRAEPEVNCPGDWMGEYHTIESAQAARARVVGHEVLQEIALRRTEIMSHQGAGDPLDLDTLVHEESSRMLADIIDYDIVEKIRQTLPEQTD